MRFFVMSAVLCLLSGCGPKASAEKYLRLLAEGKLEEAEALLEPSSAAYLGQGGLKVTYPEAIPAGRVAEIKVFGARAQVRRVLDDEVSNGEGEARAMLGDLTHTLILSKGSEGWKVLDCAAIGFMVAKQVSAKDFDRAQAGIALLNDARCDERLVPKLEALLLRDRGASYYEQGVYEKATESFHRALQLAPSALLHYHLGYVYRDNKAITNNLSRAIEQFKLAVGLEPAKAEFRSALADAYRQNGNLEGALAEFEQAVALNPEDVQTRYFRAATLLQLERYTDAAKELREVVRLDPDYRDARARLALVEEHRLRQARLRALRAAWGY